MDVTVGRNIINASTSDILSQVFGYVFWISLALVTDSHTIGEIGLIISLVTILGILIPMGLDYSMTRSVGSKIGEKKFSNANAIIKTSTSLVSLFLIVTSIAVLVFVEPISKISQISEIYLHYSIIIIISYTLHNFFRSEIIALQGKTSVIVYGEIISHVIKFAVTFGLLALEFGIISIVIGFFSHFLFKVIIWGRFLFKDFRLNAENADIHLI